MQYTSFNMNLKNYELHIIHTERHVVIDEHYVSAF